MNLEAQAIQARLDQCAALIAGVQDTPREEEIDKLKRMIAVHKASAYQLETVAAAFPDHPNVAELIDLCEEMTIKLEGLSVMYVRTSYRVI